MWEAFTFCAEGAEQICNLKQIFWQHRTELELNTCFVSLSVSFKKFKFSASGKIFKKWRHLGSLYILRRRRGETFQFESNILAKNRNQNGAQKVPRFIISFF